ncbi:MAG: late competence development ComFB family protein [Clostridiales Family XIII bacterium]|jgi:competence protein ComFB|nr:late competence development ComFB family protein [Clostridiales Family XIII bacterium]
MVEGKEKPVNLVKLIAEDMLPSVMRKMDIADTAENKEDILALALNSLPTKYVTSGGGKLYAQLIENYKTQYETDVIAGLTKAGMKVKSKPRGTTGPEGKQ